MKKHHDDFMSNLRCVKLPEQTAEPCPEAYCEWRGTDGIELPERLTEIPNECWEGVPNLPPIELPECSIEELCRLKCLNMISHKSKFAGSSDMQKPLILPKDLSKLHTGLLPFVPAIIPNRSKTDLPGFFIPKANNLPAGRRINKR